MGRKARSIKTQPVIKMVLPKKGISRALWPILGLALGLRILYLKFSLESPFYEPLLLDSAYYHQWAQRILKSGFAQEGVFYGLPLYPVFLALFYRIFDSSIEVVKWIQIGLGVLTLFFVYRIGTKIAQPAVGLCAALLGAIYGPAFFHEGQWIPEVLGLLLYTISFDQTLLFLDKPGKLRGCLLGLFVGLATLTKVGLAIFFFVFIAISLTKKVARIPAIFCLGAFFLMLAPVTIHNFTKGQDTVLLTSHSGFNFYVGNNPNAEGVFVEPDNAGGNVEAQRERTKEIAEKAMGRSLKPSEVSRYWSNKAWKFIRENPQRFTTLCLAKLALFFDAREISDVEDYAFAQNFNSMLRFPWLNFSILGPLAFLGMGMMLKDKRFRLPVLGFVFSYVIGMMAFFVNARYRFPMMGLFFVLGGYGMIAGWRLFREKRWAGMAVPFLALAAGLIVGNLRLVGTDWSRDWVNAGDAMQEKKQYERAIEFYDKAIALNPKSWKVYQAKGVALTKLGRNSEAIDNYQKSIELDALNSQSYNNLGLCYDREGRLDLAERYFHMALEKNENSWQVHNNLGMVYGKRGDNEKAAKAFETSIKLHPENARAYTNLGLILHRFGRDSEAVDLWKKALTINPDFQEAKRALELSQT